MKAKLIIFSLLILFLFVFCATTETQSKTTQKKSRTRLKMYYEKLPDNEKKFSIILTKGSGKKTSGIGGAKILLKIPGDENDLEVATVKTNANGEVVFIIEAGYLLPENENGYTEILASYNGNDSLRSARKKIEFKDINVEISFNLNDSVKYINVFAFEVDADGNNRPVEGIDMNIGVERLFSTLFFEKIETDKNGRGSIIFPDDLPGDSKGNVTIVAKIDEDDDYGTITKTAGVDWGMPVDYAVMSNGRSLFGDEAPIWMIFTIFILLAGAWYHFILATIKIIKMRYLGRNSA